MERRRLLATVGGAAAAAAVGTRLGAPIEPLPLLQLLGVKGHERRRMGVVVLNSGDCQSAWRFFELLARPSVHRSVPVDSIVTTDRPSDGSWMLRLPTLLQAVPTWTLPRRGAVALGPLGLTGVPTLLVFVEGQLERLLRAPRDGVEFVRLGRLLDVIARTPE